ncbi:MAG: type II toxin-antitoxin system RelE/ParE family toxin [Hespellia sp.]|nr:type II toxin-antitoxin system RelE/ParE family toxin [Hespellia sp.]
MDKYNVKLQERVLETLDKIYGNIADDFKEIDAAENIANTLDNAIMSLEEFPQRGAERKTGAYARRGYRQLFVKCFTIVYRIDEIKKHVVIVSVRYASSNF